jgi:formiminotetrahydrofolate cyclodeaminase
MNDSKIGSMPIETLVSRLGSDAMTPGSGAAGALALALAAACASKAIAITAKHRALPDVLADCARSIAHLQTAALHGADEDADHFRQFLQHRSAATAEELRQTDLTLFDLCQSLSDLIDRIAADIHPVVAGDISAARALVAAAAVIHQRNSATT